MRSHVCQCEFIYFIIVFIIHFHHKYIKENTKIPIPNAFNYTFMYLFRNVEREIRANAKVVSVTATKKKKKMKKNWYQMHFDWNSFTKIPHFIPHKLIYTRITSTTYLKRLFDFGSIFSLVLFFFFFLQRKVVFFPNFVEFICRVFVH